MQPKSILKKTESKSLNTNISGSLPVPKSDAEKRRLDVVIQHATLIQDQKRVQLQLLSSIEELSEYPIGQEPTTDEITKFLALVTEFQPSDYDALIEERHVNGRCAYTLCANPPRKSDIKRPWLRPKGWENWCSEACAKKAFYVKAQLDETPAWERRGGGSSALVLLREVNQDMNQTPTRILLESSIDQELADERGEKGLVTKVNQVSTDVVEKLPIRVVKAPSTVHFGPDSHLEIEGHRVSKQKHNG